MNILLKIVGRGDDVGRGAGIERRESADLPRGARTRQLGGADRVIVEIIFGRALAKGGCRRQVGTAQIHADERLKAVHVLAGARRGVPGVAKALLRITAGKAWRARGNGYLVMDRRRGQPLGLGRADRVDRPALKLYLAAQSVAFPLVEIDIGVGI